MTRQLPEDISNLVEKKLSSMASTTTINSFKHADGGCINHSGCLQTTSGDYFIKWNDRDQYPLMLEREAQGLELLRKAGSLRIPEMIAVGETDSHQLLILEKIRPSTPHESYWEELGRGLAKQHRITETEFGLPHDNYIGSLHQTNKQNESWIDFFVEQRIEKQYALMVRNGYGGKELRRQLDQLIRKLPELLAIGPPALLHGDLWSGNIMVDEEGCPCLIDPAVYFGNREADLAMTRLFGGFSTSFYDAYQAEWPLEPESGDRFAIYNLYPLMVHVNLFGGSYLHQIESTLKRFT